MVNNDLDSVFHAFGHPVRRLIVERLADGPTTVGGATRGVGISKPAVTKHIRVLERAGILKRKTSGRTHRLELDGRRLREAQVWLTDHAAIWEKQFDAVERHLAASDATKTHNEAPSKTTSQKGKVT